MNSPPASAPQPDPPIEAVLARKLEPLVKPGKTAEVMELIEVTVSKVHSGPLPAPEDFAAYEAALPGSADRIIAMAERNQIHRHKQESAVVRFEYLIRIGGQLGALLTIVILAALVGFCAYIKQPLAAAVVAALGAAAGYFLHRGQSPADGPEAPSAKPKPKRKR